VKYNVQGEATSCSGMKDDRLQLRIDPKLKEQASKILRRRHMTLSSYVTLSLQALVEAEALERRTGRGPEVEQI
jgi:hypothetical protein